MVTFAPPAGKARRFVDTAWLVLTAVWIGLTHTWLGPDHYVPFVALSRQRQWSLGRTLGVTVACGVGHVGSSIVLGFVGLAGGVFLERATNLEEARGDWAAWLLIGFGLAYAVWGLGRAIRGLPHRHWHAHDDGAWHKEDAWHGHEPGPAKPREWTPWVLFIVFLFGPCEPLIPLFIYPAAERGYSQALLVAAAFATATLVAMASAVVVLRYGLNTCRVRALDRFSHALAGLAILACGVAVKLGW